MNIAYSSYIFWVYMGFSVSLFVLIGGVNIYTSFERQERLNWKFISTRILRILMPYLVASIVYHVALYKSFNLSAFWNQLITFSASPPFYFVEFYLELIIISPVLFYLIKTIENHKQKKILLLISNLIFWAISNLLIFIRVPGGSLGAAFLFGGTFLSIFFLGISFYPLIMNLDNKKGSILLGALAFFCLIFSGIDIQRILRTPPNVYTLIYTLGYFLLIYSLRIFINYEKTLLTKVICLCGKYSLFIFLYHILFIHLTKKIVSGLIPTPYIIVFYLPIATLGPIILLKGFKKFTEAVQNYWRRLLPISRKTC